MNVRRLAPVVVAAALAASFAGSAQAGWWEQASRAKETSLETVLGAPQDWRDVTATFVVRFGSAGAATPDRDGFPATEWRAFSATSKGGKSSHDLFVRRGSAEDARLAKLAAGDDVRVRAVLRGDGKAPVLEVVWLAGPSDGLSPEETADLARADELLAVDSGEAAEVLCRRILECRDLGAPLRADLWRRIARACRSQGRLADAADAWRKVLFLAPDDAVASRDLVRIETSLAARARADGAPPALPGSEPMARAARPLPKSPAEAVPAVSVPAPALRLAPPRDRDAAGGPPAPAPNLPVAAAAAGAPAPAPAAVPAPALPPEAPPPPPPRLALPK